MNRKSSRSTVVFCIILSFASYELVANTTMSMQEVSNIQESFDDVIIPKPTHKACDVEENFDDVFDILDDLAQEAEERGLTKSGEHDDEKPSRVQVAFRKFMILSLIKYLDMKEYVLDKLRRFVLFVCPCNEKKKKRSS